MENENCKMRWVAGEARVRSRLPSGIASAIFCRMLALSSVRRATLSNPRLSIGSAAVLQVTPGRRYLRYGDVDSSSSRFRAASAQGLDWSNSR